MITITPAFSILKSVVDDNIVSQAAQLREQAFSKATELQSLSDVSVLIDGSIFARIKVKLQPEHITFFEKTYRIDDSVTGLSQYNHDASLRWVAKSESHSRRVVIIADNPTEFAGIACDKICTVTPQDFLGRANQALDEFASRKYSSLEDALTAKFFR